MNERLQQKILACTDSGSATECWLWRGQISNTGYGRIKYKDDDGGVYMQSANYVSYLAFVGPVPEGSLVRQTCGNRLCVNPDHLEIFDPDAWKKGA